MRLMDVLLDFYYSALAIRPNADAQIFSSLCPPIATILEFCKYKTEKYSYCKASKYCFCKDFDSPLNTSMVRKIMQGHFGARLQPNINLL